MRRGATWLGRGTQTVAQHASEDGPQILGREVHVAAPALQRPELPAVVAVFKRLLERVRLALVVAQGSRLRVVREPVQDDAIDVPLFVTHDLCAAHRLKAFRALCCDVVEIRPVVLIQRDQSSGQGSPAERSFRYGSLVGLWLDWEGNSSPERKREGVFLERPGAPYEQRVAALVEILSRHMLACKCFSLSECRHAQTNCLPRTGGRCRQ